MQCLKSHCTSAAVISTIFCVSMHRRFIYYCNFYYDTSAWQCYAECITDSISVYMSICATCPQGLIGNQVTQVHVDIGCPNGHDVVSICHMLVLYQNGLAYQH